VGNKDDVLPRLVAFDKEDAKVQVYDVYANPKKDDSKVAVNITAPELINKYLMALGGIDKLNAVKSMDQTYSMELMGMAITARQVQDKGRFYMSMTAPGMNLMKQIYDGEKGVAEQGGGRSELKGSDLDAIKEQSMLFPERKYTEAGYTLELKGLEDVNGNPAYRLNVTTPSGTKSTEYYDATTFLKVKEIETAETQGQTMTTTYEYSDYKSVDGIMIPHTLTIIGPMPTPMVMKTTEVKVNSTIDPALFKI
jgi:hypothetical protein